jgi:SecD/SecF fusion protein
MLLYYLWAGLISVFGLVLNVVLTLGLMSAFGATITLPGVAALVLTIGMAVDANILVFERIREELGHGKPLKIALREGYDMAQSTILDANLTTLMSAGVLIFMGTGPVKGFGVILAIGIVATVFTVLVTCRGLQEFFVNHNLKLPIFGIRIFKGNTKFQFLNVAKPAFIVSWTLLVICIGLLIHKGDEAFSKDFKGGEAAVVRIAEGQTQKDPGDIIKIATDAGVSDVTATYQSALGGGKELTLRLETELSVNVKTGADGKPLKTRLADFTQVNKAISAIRAQFPDHFPKGDFNSIVASRESVGGAVSGSLQKNAIISMLLALFGIAIYVALRFEPGMGLGAFVSSLHDVLLTGGLYILVGKQFSVSMIAAILMVIGYSINDTIIVFDRIREEMKVHPGMSLRDVIHLAINRTLARTVLTSLTVLLCAIALWQFGAGDVKEYGLLFVFGVITGTFSSVFIAGPIFYWWHKGQRGSVEKAEAQVRYEWEAGAEVKTKKRDPLLELPAPQAE